ncbi:hypothetical protein PVNG_05803 [Plasmodium vivax North Korean]|uniref:Variable surface protein Vir7-like protein n=1 Tax=Plasmodium vivax North Korean TaxID=1035514 RepID=A0A0J9TN26_PLAVI|nr:hypothetical protein PVNG_05803 [Plasmodium vivax North Korean]
MNIEIIKYSDNKLNDLRTRKIYDQLDKAKDICQDVGFYKTAKDLLSNFNGLQNVSDKILKGLCYAYGNNFQNETDDDICNFLYYWLGEILYDNLIPRINLGSVISKLFVILRIRNRKKCTLPPYYNILEEKNFKNIKLFFDYSKDYDTYEKQITSNNLSCSKNYNEYLKKYVETYKEVQSECQKKTTSGYCKAFNDYFLNKESKNLSNWKCNLQNNDPKPDQAHAEREKIKEPQLPASRLDGRSVTLTKESEGGGEKVTERHSSPFNPPSEGISELDIASSPSDGPPTSTTTKSIATAASVAGILVPPFLVYNVISATIVKLIVLFYI